MSNSKRVFSGIRPSGRLHLGNYLGAIKNWLELQDKYDCIYGIVDYHAITTPFSPKKLKEDAKNLILDLLALGLDLKKSSLIIQSQISAHLELAWILSSICPLSWLNRIPTFKEKVKAHPEYVNLGLLSYPILMAADILIYKANLVPVGEDQLPHIELTNKLVRRFNKMFGKTFDEVKPILTKGGRIMSLTDPSKKMSKTGDEGIGLFDQEEEIKRKIKKAVTDSGKEIIYQPNKKPAISNLVMIYHLLSGLSFAQIEKKFKGKGYAEFKKDLTDLVVKFLKPFQEKRKKLAGQKEKIEKILKDCQIKTQKIAEKNLKEIKKKVGLD